jgi:arylsulfatase
MAKDRSEVDDLAREHPERVRELSAAWDTWAARADVLPIGAWHGKQAAKKAEQKD